MPESTSINVTGVNVAGAAAAFDRDAGRAAPHAHGVHAAHGGEARDHAHNPLVAHQFDDLDQQKDASTLGMWSFLATEVMFFGGALLGYSVYRNHYHDAFAAASRLEDWRIGCFNTFVLLFSSFTVVLAVNAAHHGNARGIIRWLGATIGLALVFLGVKAYEYTHLYHEHLIPGANFKFHEPQHQEAAQIFFSFYFAMTGLHALHMVIGIGVILVVMWMAKQGRFTSEYYNPVEVTGLYWHFVDLVWIFLYPLLYLISPVWNFGAH